MKYFTAIATLLGTLGCGSTPPGARGSEAPADMVIVGSIRTLESPGARAEALAIKDGRITSVGRCAEVQQEIGETTTVYRLPPGAEVIAGLADAHAHLYGLGKALETVDLRAVPSELAAAELIEQAAASRPAGAWITGRGWDQNLWSPAEFPTAASLARVSRHPVAIRRVDGHALWANPMAISLAEIDADTPDPKGGTIVRNDHGTATGVFVDTAIDLVERKIPKADDETRERRIRLAAKKAASLGLTAVHDMGIDRQTAAVYRRLADRGELEVRVYGLLAYEEGLEKRLGPPTRAPGMFELRAVKMFADGALGSRGAALLEEYSDAKGKTGLVISTEEDIRKAGTVLTALGYQLAVHAIGDRGNRITLDAFEAIIGAAGSRDLRLRVEHAQVLAPNDLGRFAKLRVIASMQPTHATSDMPWAEARLGPERIKGSYAWRALIDSGATLAFGSDFPVERPSPLLGIHAAVTRQDGAGNPVGGWYPDERLTLDEALLLFSAAPAFAAFAEHHRGRIRPGFAADLTIFDAPLTPDRSLLTRHPLATLTAGKLTFTAPSFPAAGPTAVCK